MRFFLVDRITEISPGSGVKGRKNVSLAEDFFNDLDTGAPTYPPAMLVESLAQLGVWFLASSSDFTQRAVLLSMGEVVFERPVVPGDQLELEIWSESQSDEAAVVSGQISVDQATVMRMTDCLCAIVPAGDLDEPAATRRMFDHLTADLSNAPTRQE